MTQPTEDRNCPKCGVSSLVRNENCPPMDPTDHPETKTNFYIEEAQDLMSRGYLRDGGTQQYRNNTVEEVARAIRNAHEKGIVYGRTIGRLESIPCHHTYKAMPVNPLFPDGPAEAVCAKCGERPSSYAPPKESELESLIRAANIGLDALCAISVKYRDQVEEGGDGCQTVPFGTVAVTAPRHRIQLKRSPDPNCKHTRTQFKSINTGERFRDKYFVCEDCGVKLPYSPEIPKKDRRK